MEVLITVPPSALAISNLEPIPGSAVPTPSPSSSIPTQESQNGPCFSDPPEAGPSRPRSAVGLGLGVGIGAGSRRSSLSAFPSMPGSYFPPATKSSQTSIPSPPPGGLAPSLPISTPIPIPLGERPRPTQIEIPAGTPEDPLFSAYPHSAGPSRTGSVKGKGRTFNLPLLSAFTARDPVERSRRNDENVSSGSPTRTSTLISGDSSVGSSPPPDARPRARRRASTISHTPDNSPPPRDRRDTSRSRYGIITPTRTLRLLRRRRATVGSAPDGVEFHVPGEQPHWPAMPSEEARRLDPDPSPTAPFSYQHAADSEYTLQSVSTVATVRPLSSPTPSVSQRKSSLVAAVDAHLQAGGSFVLGLSDVPPALAAGVVDILIPEDASQPHDPPVRRSSLDFGPDVIIQLKPHDLDGESNLSASLTTESGSAEAFSPSSSAPHPLSSTSTSLSRSAKSGESRGGVDGDGNGEVQVGGKEAGLSALRLQRSLEWEAKQTRLRGKLARRKMILLELVETEVAYAEDLKALVHVYLPQLYALPSISERMADIVARNAKDLLEFHDGLALRMVDILREQGVDHELLAEPLVEGRIEMASRRLAQIFVDEVASFSAYNEFCAGSIAAANLIKRVTHRTDYEAYERRCQIICASQPHVTLKDLLYEHDPTPRPAHRNRLHFRDYLIMPIQRVCRYPLLLGQLLESASASSPNEERAERAEFNVDGQEEYDVRVDVERALGAMRGVAEEADEARRKMEAEVKSATILQRMEQHHVLTPAFIKSLGTCRLIGSLDVLHHHPTVAPLMPPVKVKYLAAFLYRGYLILAKVKKGRQYEPKHFLPLEVFELIDITEGFLPHSIRLTLREHNFDLAASCDAEKEVWAAALCAARDESTVPPFELPASVSPFAARSRRMSTIGTLGAPNEAFVPATPTHAAKRHTVVGLSDLFGSPSGSPEAEPSTPLGSPTRSSFSAHSTPRRPSASSTILLRRASASQRLIVDRGLNDVFSESCAQARSKAQMSHPLFLPVAFARGSDARDRLSMVETSTLRRRRSFLDARTGSFDIAFSGEIKGSIIPTRVPSNPGRQRVSTGLRHGGYGGYGAGAGAGAGSGAGRGDDSATEFDPSADDTATSDYGTLRGRDNARGSSVGSATCSPAPSPRPSLQNLRQARADSSPSLSPSRGFLSLSSRRTFSSSNLGSRPPIPSRAKSTPVSPIITPAELPASNLPHRGSDPEDAGYFPSVTEESESSPAPRIRARPGRPHTADSSNRDGSSTNLSGGSGAWITLKRSLSLARVRSGTGTAGTGTSAIDVPMLAEHSSGASGEDSGSDPDVMVPGFKDGDHAPLVSSSVSEEPEKTDHAEVVVQPLGTGDVGGAESGAGTGGGGSERQVPRRKKSMRILQQLSRLTPI